MAVAGFPKLLAAVSEYGAPTVDAVINDLMDWAWHAVYEPLSARGLLGDGLVVEEYTGLMSWVEGPIRYTVVHSTAVAVLFVDTDPVDATIFHRDLLGSADPKLFSAWHRRTGAGPRRRPGEENRARPGASAG